MTHAESFTTDTDCNGILWERFAAHHQAAEINEIWPEAGYISEENSPSMSRKSRLD
jgi:hypothetical protein